MSFFRMGNRIRNRSFEYIPRHYDPVKEDLEQRVKGYNSKADATEIAKNRIRHNFRKSSKESRRYAQKARKRSNYRLLVIVAFLSAMTFIFLSKFLPQLEAIIK